MTSPTPRNKMDASAHSRASFWRYYFPGRWSVRSLVTNPFLVVLTISLLVTWFENSRIVVEVQSWSLGILLKTARPVQFDDVYVVHISDSDYRDPRMFQSQSPLQPTKVVDLIHAVASLKPKVVGVDLDTKESAWHSAIGPNCRVESGTFSLLPPEPILVWARVPVEPKSRQSASPGEKPIQLYQLLGGAEDCKQALSGVPRFPLDADGVVRRYTGEFKIDAEAEKQSFARAIAEAYGGIFQKSKSERILNFAADNPKSGISAGALCAVAPEGDCNGHDRHLSAADQGKAKQWVEAARGKIVLIGGAFEDARDTYATPVGEKYGVDLNALAIESDLHSGAIYDTPRPLLLMCDLLAGTIVVWVFWFFESRPTLALVLGTLGIGAASLLVSWLLFYFLSVWLSFIPVLVGVNIHQYYEHLRETWKAGQQVKKATHTEV